MLRKGLNHDSESLLMKIASPVRISGTLDVVELSYQIERTRRNYDGFLVGDDRGFGIHGRCNESSWFYCWFINGKDKTQNDGSDMREFAVCLKNELPLTQPKVFIELRRIEYLEFAAKILCPPLVIFLGRFQFAAFPEAKMVAVLKNVLDPSSSLLFTEWKMEKYFVMLRQTYSFHYMCYIGVTVGKLVIK